MSNKTTQKERVENLENKVDKIVEILGKMASSKVEEAKKSSNKVTKKAKVTRATNTLDHMVSLVKTVNKATVRNLVMIMLRKYLTQVFPNTSTFTHK